jgi:two-component system alkaline phosphatase synthesis response regulator PhoP
MSSFNQKSILLVEDEKLIREGYKKLLELKGYKITGASDGKKAVKALSHDNFDLIITDIQMPEMDGIELISILETRDLLKKVIVITAYHDFGDDDLFHKLMKSGVAGTLHKTFTLSELLQIIEKVFTHELQA